jgi:hypothetical protein
MKVGFLLLQTKQKLLQSISSENSASQLQQLQLEQASRVKEAESVVAETKGQLMEMHEKNVDLAMAIRKQIYKLIQSNTNRHTHTQQ